jgi:hypothetical protein
VVQAAAVLLPVKTKMTHYPFSVSSYWGTPKIVLSTKSLV